MDSQSRAKTLLETIRQGLLMSSANSANLLGDRAKYLGVSEIAKFSECPRAAVMARLAEPDGDMARLLATQRGHWFENGIKFALASANLNGFHQLEIAARRKSGAIMAHLDFTLVWKQPRLAVRILEIKSTGNLPKEPYAAHVEQAQAQINLLRQYWNKPVFSLRNANGEILHEKLTFPAICKQRLDLEMPVAPRKVSLESWLLYISMSEAKPFGPYAYAPETLDALFARADAFRAYLKQCEEDASRASEIPFAKGYYPLCSWCGYNAGCPKFRQGQYQPQWENAILKLEALKEERDRIHSEITQIENALKQAYSFSKTKDWIDTGSHRFRMAMVAGRKSLDKTALHYEISNIFNGMGVEINVDDLFKSCEKQGASFPRLSITSVN